MTPAMAEFEPRNRKLGATPLDSDGHDEAPPSGKSADFRPRVRWKKLPDVALSAFIAALVTIVISPMSQSLSFYLSQFLSRPILSIEYVEAIQATPIVSLDISKLQALVDLIAVSNTRRVQLRT